MTGDDAKRADDLGKAIAAALTADRWDEAISRADELHALRRRGPKHFETVSEEWKQKTLRRLAEALALTAELSGGVERGKGARPVRRPRFPPAATTTGRMRHRTSGPRSCWRVIRIDS